MFRLESEQALVDAFRPRDQAVLQLPTGRSFPLFVRDYLTWAEPAGHCVFLVFRVDGGVPTGIAFCRTPPQSGIPRMCDWCHSPDTGQGVGLLTADRNSRKRVGVHVCQDLGCRGRVEDAALRAGRSPLDATRALLARIARFAQHGVGIDPGGVGRNAPASRRPQVGPSGG
jgi:hypothetical protein